MTALRLALKFKSMYVSSPNSTPFSSCSDIGATISNLIPAMENVGVRNRSPVAILQKIRNNRNHNPTINFFLNIWSAITFLVIYIFQSM